MVIKDPNERAVQDIFDQLYNSKNAINKEELFKAMKVLMEYYDRDDIKECDEDCLCVVHESELQEEIDISKLAASEAIRILERI